MDSGWQKSLTVSKQLLTDAKSLLVETTLSVVFQLATFDTTL
jgi:hypothetical protein